MHTHTPVGTYHDFVPMNELVAAYCYRNSAHKRRSHHLIAAGVQLYSGLLIAARLWSATYLCLVCLCSAPPTAWAGSENRTGTLWCAFGKKGMSTRL